jgi:hypothetical protein
MNGSLKIDWATHDAAKYACEHWHYSRCIPKSKLVKVGVWECGQFKGAVIFGYGATAALGKPYGLAMQQCCELVRVALTHHQNPVSKILSLAIKMLRKKCPNLRLIVSFADANQGHHGGIYQATNWTYAGKSAPAIFYRDPSGRLWHPRRASRKPNKQKHLVTNKWTEEYQSGKHRYLMPLDSEMRTKILPLSRPYPKRAGSDTKDTPANPAGEGGSTPTPALHSQAA